MNTFIDYVEVLLLFDEIRQMQVHCWAWPDNRFDEIKNSYQGTENV